MTQLLTVPIPSERQLALPIRLDFRYRGSLKQYLYKRCQNCFYCGRRFRKKNLTIDHVEPLSRGGGDVLGNMVLCCRECNKAKDDCSLIEWIQKLVAAYLRLQEVQP